MVTQSERAVSRSWAYSEKEIMATESMTSPGSEDTVSRQTDRVSELGFLIFKYQGCAYTHWNEGLRSTCF